MSNVERTERQLVRIAVLGIALLAGLLLLAMNFTRLPLVGAGATTYRAEFTDASGLAVGEEVRVAGVKVGKVTDITLGRGKVVVEFEVAGIDLGRNTSAGIEVKTVLGQHYLSVTPAGDGELPEGATIPMARTTTPVNIVPAFNQLAEQSAAIDTEQVAEAFDALATVLDRTAPEMRRTLHGLARLSHTVSSRDEELRTLFRRTRQVSGVVAARDRDIAALLGTTTQVLEVLDRRRATIVAIIDGTSRLSRQLTGLIRDNRADLGPALQRLNGVLDVLRANRKQLDQILDVGTLYAREFVNVGGSGRWFDATVKLPRAFALCEQGENGALGDLVGGILAQANQSINDSDQPCLPLGPASGGTQ